MKKFFHLLLPLLFINDFVIDFRHIAEVLRGSEDVAGFVEVAAHAC